MSEPRPGDAAQGEQLAQALVRRGLVTQEDVRASLREDTKGPQDLLRRLVRAGHLTPGQARRALKELPALLDQRIPGYVMLEKVGQGSMGAVFRARQLSMDRLVAVKVLHARLARSAEYIALFQREALLAARLSHNNVIQAIDVGAAGELHYFVMELVEGRTIREEIDAGTVYSESAAVGIILQVAQALAHAHRRGLIHRDIKPANIVLTPEGIAKLADLGLARRADDLVQARQEKGLTIGTPYYMAPEQIQGREDVDARADLYSLGATLYHMVTGRPPFGGATVEEVLEGHLRSELTPPDHINQGLSAGLGEVVELLMARRREDRYRSADDLLVDLECLLAGEPPRLARRQISLAALEQLAHGEGEEEETPAGRYPLVPIVWALAALLLLSVLLNLVLLLR